MQRPIDEIWHTKSADDNHKPCDTGVLCELNAWYTLLLQCGLRQGGIFMASPILVFGHKNPDNDAICAAIGYACLKNDLARKNGEEFTKGA